MSLLVLIVTRAIWLYQLIIIVYILMSWVRPSKGVLAEVYDALSTICEPYLGIFRRFIPVMGGLDISPIAALIVLNIISLLVSRLA